MDQRFMDLVYWVIAVSEEAGGQGRKIEAIKRCREHSGLGLKEAKDYVEAIMAVPFDRLLDRSIVANSLGGDVQAAIAKAVREPIEAETRYQERYVRLEAHNRELENRLYDTVPRHDYQAEVERRRAADAQTRKLKDTVIAQGAAIGNLSRTITTLVTDDDF